MKPIEQVGQLKVGDWIIFSADVALVRAWLVITIEDVCTGSPVSESRLRKMKVLFNNQLLNVELDSGHYLHPLQVVLRA